MAAIAIAGSADRRITSQGSAALPCAALDADLVKQATVLPLSEGNHYIAEIAYLVTRRYRTPNIAQVRRRMSAASAPLAGSSTTSALLSASLPRPTAPTALESLHRHRTLISSPSSAIILLSSSDGRPYALKLAKAAETGGETDRETDGETGGKTGGETDRETDAELNPQRADDGLATTSARAHAADGRRIKGGNAACTGGSGNSTGGSGMRAYSAASVVQRLHRELLALHAVSKSETAQLSTPSLSTTTTTTTTTTSSSTTTASTSCEGFDSFIVRAYGACRLGATHVATLFEWLPGGSLSDLLERQVHVLSLVPNPFFGSHVSVSYSYEPVFPLFISPDSFLLIRQTRGSCHMRVHVSTSAARR